MGGMLGERGRRGACTRRVWALAGWAAAVQQGSRHAIPGLPSFEMRPCPGQPVPGHAGGAGQGQTGAPENAGHRLPQLGAEGAGHSSLHCGGHSARGRAADCRHRRRPTVRRWRFGGMLTAICSSLPIGHIAAVCCGGHVEFPTSEAERRGSPGAQTCELGDGNRSSTARMPRIDVLH